MATGPKLDGAGQVKMETLTNALAQIQQLHAVVERMAMEAKNMKPISPLVPQLKRVATPLASGLKAQFGLLSDQVTQMLLAATRGGGDQMRVRALREGVAQVRQALEIQVTLVKNKHTVEEEKH